MAGDPQFEADREMFHFLLSHRESITRNVKAIPNGVETLTESDDPEVADMIRRHVESMHRRLADGRPIHMRDPLFAAVFAHATSSSPVGTVRGEMVASSSRNNTCSPNRA